MFFFSASAAETQVDYVGRYTFDLKLMQYMSSDTSMGNNAFVQSGVLVVNKDKSAMLEVDLHSMKYFGKMQRITKVNAYNKYGTPIDFETVDAEVFEEYVGVYDDFNDPESSYAVSCAAV